MKMNTEEVGSYSSRYKRQKTSALKESQEKDHLPSGEDRAARSAEEERRTARSEPPRGHQGRSVVNPGSSVDRSKETREKELAAARQGKQREGSARSDVPPGCNTLIVHPGPANVPHRRRSSGAIEEIRSDARVSKQPTTAGSITTRVVKFR
ncbi:hypothetical protein AtEden1_Chr1g0035251 [Arabidopsis thaliana]